MVVKECVLLHLGGQESRRRCSGPCCRHPKPHVPTDPAAAWRWHAPPTPRTLSHSGFGFSGSPPFSLGRTSRHTRGLLDNPLLIFHQGLCTAHCQATILPLSHLCSSLPPGHLRRHANPATLQGAPHEALWLPFGSPLTVQPRVRTNTVPPRAHLYTYGLSSASCPLV